MGYRIVELLVRIAKGTAPTDDNKRGFYPYGKPSAVSTSIFKLNPPPWYSIALTFLYPYIVKSRTEWGSLEKKYSHPMNATGLWPVAVVNRYMSFFSLFRSNRDKLFCVYEEQDGTYHGPEPSFKTVLTDKQLTPKDIDEMSSDTEDSVDGVFL